MRLRHAAVILVAALAVAGCGDEERTASPDAAEAARPAGATDGDPITLAQVRAAFEEAGLMTVQTGLGPALDTEVSEPALAAKRYEISPTSKEFELYVFPTIALARQAVRDLADTEMVENGGAIARGGNVVAAFPEPPREVGGYRVVERVLARFSDGRAGDAR